MPAIDYCITTSKLARLLSALIIVLIAVTPQAQEADDLYTQILALQNQMKIQITGLNKIQNEPSIIARGRPEEQLQQLLAPYNHVLTRNSKGQIERVVIVNKIQKQAAESIILPASFQNNHYKVSVSLSGNGSVWQSVDMVIDTGADVVVLPESMINQLGLTETELTHEKMQTANGVADAKVGLLQELKLAGETLQNIPVAFIDDSLLGKNYLLGMAVLGRYQLTIDDQSKTVTLFKKY
jgi:clan AA aspartic protease (TIGR02281 family)